MPDYIYSNKITEYHGLVCGSFYSLDKYGPLMYGFNRKNSNILNNRKRFFKNLDIKLEDIVFQEQKHSTNIKIISKKDRGKGAFSSDDSLKNNDGMISDLKGVFLCIYTADCVPFFIYDYKLGVIGAAHAGWKGVKDKLPNKMALKFNKAFNSKYSDLICFIGPSIGICCYEVSKVKDNRIVDFISLFGDNVVVKENDKTFLDLREAINIQLQELGLLKENIEISPVCNCCDKKFHFPSYYKEGKDLKGQILSIIGIHN